MWMRAVHARHSTGYGLNRLGESRRQFDFLAGTCEELRSNASAQVLIFAPEFQRQIALRSTKQFFGVELRTVPDLHRHRAMSRDAQLVRSRNPQHLDASSHWRYHHGMRPIRYQGIEGLQPR